MNSCWNITVWGLILAFFWTFQHSYLSINVSQERDSRILSEELSVCAGELDTLLLRWDDGWLPGLLLSSKEGAGEGLSGTRSCNPSSHKYTPTQNKYPVQRVQVKQQISFNKVTSLPVLKSTFITEVTILEGRLWPCAAAAMLAMVLRWFIWLIAMVTEAGGRLTGIRGCGIIMKGSSRPETHEEVVDYSMMHIISEVVTEETCEAPPPDCKPAGGQFNRHFLQPIWSLTPRKFCYHSWKKIKK